MQTSNLRPSPNPVDSSRARRIAEEENQGPEAWQLTALVVEMAQLIVELFQLMHLEMHQQALRLPVRAGFSGSAIFTNIMLYESRLPHRVTSHRCLDNRRSAA